MSHNKQTIQKLSTYRLLFSLAGLSAISIILLFARIMASDSFRYSFLFWNLFLAMVPALLAWWLVRRVQRFGWLKWQQIVLTVVWFVFLPNSFYLITDLIHLRPNYEADLLFDINLLMSFILSGISYGFISIYLVHHELFSRMRQRYSYLIVSGIFLIVSFAVCLGRYTRWNTWDIILRPAGLLFDVSDRLINPANHMQTYITTITLALVLVASYTVVWEAARLIRQKN